MTKHIHHSKLSLAALLILVLLAWFVIKPLALPGFFPMHDDTQPSRMYEMTKALQDGMFPVRWSADLGYGYGYPLFNFYAPFVYYVGGVIGIIGLDPISVTKLLMGVGLIISGITMYALGRDIWGENGGLISGIMYLFVPYHALNIYVRGDLAEFWASIFIPIIFWGIWRIQKHKQSWYMGIVAVSYAVVIISHNLTGLMITPFIGLFIGILWLNARQEKQRFEIRRVVISFLFGILLSTFYWLPVFAEMGYTNVASQIGGKADFALHFVCPLQLWDSPWGFGGSAAGCIDGMSFRLGKLHIVLSLVAASGLWLLYKKQKTQFWVGIVAASGLALSLWLTTDTSRVLWQVVPGMSYFQYPWRFLLVTAFFASLLVGGIAVELETMTERLPYKTGLSYGLLVIIAFSAIGLYSKLFVPQEHNARNVNTYTSANALHWPISRISDEYMPNVFKKPTNATEVITQKLVVEQGSAVIVEKEKKTQLYTANIQASKPSLLRLQTAYFPGWIVSVDGKIIHHTNRDRGLAIPLEPGRHELIASFDQTTIEKLANLVSLTGLAGLILAIIILRGQTSAKLYHGNKKT